MKTNWIITNLPEKITDKQKKCVLKKIHFCFFLDNKSNFSQEDSVYVLLDGYVIPRIEYYKELAHMSQKDIIHYLFKKKGIELINYIKGIFSIVIIHKDNFYIFNDRHSIKKFFIYQENKYFFISNNLKAISRSINLSFNKQNAAIFCLMEHFIDGLTLFNNVFHSKPATVAKFEKVLKIENYWVADELLNLEKKEISYSTFSNKWKSIIKNYIDYLKPRDITMTLTGGNDSRMILSALLNIGIKPNAFTFGNPKSNDGVIAQKIANKINLNYHNYFVENPSPEWFNEYAEKIIDIGNSLVNIHRAHRLHAIEKGVKQNPDNEMIFAGFMGGDYIKGIIYDDYITAKIVRLLEYNEEPQIELLKNLLEENFIENKQVNSPKLLDEINNQKFRKEAKKINREFRYVYSVIGCMHDSQDTNIFNNKIKYVVNPFMDIDFLELLFNSKYSMLSKDNSSRNQIKRLTQSSLHVNITHLLAPQLSDIEYAKKGCYNAEEFLGNKLRFFLLRLYRYYFKKSKYPPNFPYDEWIQEFCKGNILRFSAEVKSICSFNSLLKNVKNNDHEKQEKYWHRFTNLINIDLNVKKYSGKSHE